jgi:hypothetical protein
MKFTIFQESRPGKRPTNEDRIAYWHDLVSGFGGRKPMDEF